MAKATTKSTAGFVAKGGKGKMFGQQGAKTAKSGGISQSQPGKGGKFASGGKGKMFGFSGVKSAKPC